MPRKYDGKFYLWEIRRKNKDGEIRTYYTPKINLSIFVLSFLEWGEGQPLQVEPFKDGILIRPAKKHVPFSERYLKIREEVRELMEREKESL